MDGLHLKFSTYCTKYSNDDYDWVHYVHDYYQRLLAGSSVVGINPYRGNSFRYRFADFLAECNIPKEAAWIVLYINQMDSDTNFENLQWMRLPNMLDVQKLRKEFETVRSHKKDVRNEM